MVNVIAANSDKDEHNIRKIKSSKKGKGLSSKMKADHAKEEKRWWWLKDPNHHVR